MKWRYPAAIMMSLWAWLTFRKIAETISVFAPLKQISIVFLVIIGIAILAWMEDEK